VGYNNLSESGMSDDARKQEAVRIVTILEEHHHRMQNHESDFVNKMRTAWSVSTKQLFWLRDLKDKYL
jgi:hypothetical protein